MGHRIVEGILSAAVADAGTVAISYPAREGLEYPPTTGPTDEGHYYGGTQHRLVMAQQHLTSPQDFTLTLTTTTITLTNKSGSTWAAGSAYKLEIQEPGSPLFINDPIQAIKGKAARTAKLVPVLVNLGAPDAPDVDGICATQLKASAGALSINGALASGGEVILDCPRGVVVDTDSAGDTTQVVTVSGYDVYGKKMVETITCNGTTAVQGKKAFSVITDVSISAALTANIFIGTTDVLGLPVFLPGTTAGYCVRELENGAAATAGAFVAGVQTAGGTTATDGDVRGTYDPNSTADGDKVFQVMLMLPDPDYLGMPQYETGWAE